VFGYLNDPQELTLFGAQLFDSVARGTLKVHIHKEYSFTAHDARNAHTDLSSGVTSGKIILKVAA
jgi:NADPH2:quinone reductase